MLFWMRSMCSGSGCCVWGARQNKKLTFLWYRLIYYIQTEIQSQLIDITNMALKIERNKSFRNLSVSFTNLSCHTQHTHCARTDSFAKCPLLIWYNIICCTMVFCFFLLCSACDIFLGSFRVAELDEHLEEK